MNRTSDPIVIDMENNAGERYFAHSHWRTKGLELVQPWVDEHRATLEPGQSHTTVVSRETVSSLSHTMKREAMRTVSGDW